MEIRGRACHQAQGAVYLHLKYVCPSRVAKCYHGTCNFSYRVLCVRAQWARGIDLVGCLRGRGRAGEAPKGGGGEGCATDLGRDSPGVPREQEPRTNPN